MSSRDIPKKFCPGPQSRYRQLPVIGEALDDLLTWLRQQHYAESTIRNYIKAIARSIRWLQTLRGSALSELSHSDLALAYEHFHGPHSNEAAAARVLEKYCRERQLIRESEPKPVPPSERQLEAFGSYLREVRGFAPSTIVGHLGRLRLFLRFLKYDEDPSAVRTLNLEQIEVFLRKAAKTNNRFSLQHVVASIRGFLRHQYAEGLLPVSLYEQIDTPRTYRLEQLPRALPWEKVVALLRSIDCTEPRGLRDFTILYLAARYGLRSSELVRLKLDDIDWRSEVLQVPQSKTRQRLRLPLTDEAGDILVRYLRNARPDSHYRELFLRQRAPLGPLAHTAVHDILENRIHLSGLDLPRMGTHVLRHSLAVHLLRCGTSMEAIGDVLGHRELSSTSVYLRLAVEDLREVGLPVPNEGDPVVLEPMGWKRRLPGVRPPRRKNALGNADFRSGLSQSLQSYLVTRRALGRRYENEERTLRDWDDFMGRHYEGKCEIVLEMFDRWAETMNHLTATVRRKRMRIVRNFLIFHARSHPETSIPELATFPKANAPNPPRLVSETEMARLLATASGLAASHQNPLRGPTIRLALILLFCCGLRRGELLRLRIEHFDSTEDVLRIDATKFHKSRLIPLSESVARELTQYLRLRRSRRLPIHPESALIWSDNPVASENVYSATALANNWHQLCLSADVLDARGRPPRLHDLRHSFAVTALNRWYEQGENVQAKLPHLATYMGHVSPSSTHHYLHLTPGLCDAASQRFHQYAGEIFKNGGNQ